MSAAVSTRSPSSSSGPVIPVAGGQQPTLLGITHAPQVSDMSKLGSTQEIMYSAPGVSSLSSMNSHSLASPMARVDQDREMHSGSACLEPLPHMSAPVSDGNMLPMAQGEDWANPGIGKGVGKKKKEKSKRPVEVVICQGTNTMLPKSRSSGERKYICNGHAIHRVTFWRHRKHGCPHSTGQPGSEGHLDQSGSPTSGGSNNQAGGSKMTPPPSSGNHEFEGPSGKKDANVFAPGHTLIPGLSSFKMKAVPMNNYPMVDMNMNLGGHVPDVKSHFDIPAIRYDGKHAFSMAEITPGSVPSHLDPMALGPQIPASLAHSPFHIGGQRIGSSHPPNHRFDMMPSFSMVPDSMNLYYAPYRPAELEEEEISSPINANYANPTSPYGSERSEASDFLEDTDMVFKSYLERNE